MSIADQLRHTQPLKITGFSYDPPPYGGLEHRFPSDEPVQEVLQRFVDRVGDAVGRTYLPIYRMADGEFVFMVGDRATAASASRSPVPALRSLVGRGLRHVRRNRIKTCWGEAYGQADYALARVRFEESLRKVARTGILAPYFVIRPDRWGERFFPPVCEWLESRAIEITKENFIPFYAVYALLNGPYRDRLFKNRTVLVVTHVNPGREEAIRGGLDAEGVGAVHFLPISANRSLLDDIELDDAARDADIALVAAGIGSVNILAQLEPLGIPCIDSGISLECIANPDRRWERPFLIDDSRVTPGELREYRRTARFGRW